MANFEAYRWNFSSSTNSEIGRSVLLQASVLYFQRMICIYDNVQTLNRVEILEYFFGSFLLLAWYQKEGVDGDGGWPLQREIRRVEAIKTRFKLQHFWQKLSFYATHIGCGALPWHFEFYISKCKNFKM